MPPGTRAGASIFRPAWTAEQMELTCDKYKKKMESETASCEHLEEHCKFRGACIINFLTRQRLRRERDARAGQRGEDESGDE